MNERTERRKERRMERRNEGSKEWRKEGRKEGSRSRVWTLVIASPKLRRHSVTTTIQLPYYCHTTALRPFKELTVIFYMYWILPHGLHVHALTHTKEAVAHFPIQLTGEGAMFEQQYSCKRPVEINYREMDRKRYDAYITAELTRILYVSISRANTCKTHSNDNNDLQRI